ncbi:MAG: hypothetical protein HYX50_04780 [Chloroflexi bacterium]|nr:hypothetical protein [Chloroflexota bacterium]
MPSRAATAWLCAIFALALLLRLAWVAYTDTRLLPLSDPQYYHATATNLAEGRGYSVTMSQDGFVAGPGSQSTAFWAPGYPFVLAPLYRLFGAEPGVAKIFNAIVGALTVAPVFVLGRALTASEAGRRRRGPLVAGERGGLLAAALFGIMPSLVYWTPSLFSEPLFTLGIATTLALALWAAERRTLVALAITGVALAATVFVRSQGLLMALPVAVLLWPRNGAAASAGTRLRDLARAGVPVIAGVALLVVPWAVRNQAVMGSPYLINDNLGYNLRLANGPYSQGTSVPPQDLWDERPGISFRERELFFADVGTSRALRYMRDNPGRELQLALKREGYLSRSDAEAAVQWSESLGLTPIASSRLWVLLGDLYYYPLVLLAASALFVVGRNRTWWALWSAVGVWVALHLVFAGEPRYHVPLMPAAAALAAASLLRAWDALAADAAVPPDDQTSAPSLLP